SGRGSMGAVSTSGSLTISGIGTMGYVSAASGSTVNISGGSIQTVSTGPGSTVNLSGGNISELNVYGGAVSLSGGSGLDSLQVIGRGTPTVTGYCLGLLIIAHDDHSISYRLTGVLADGHRLNAGAQVDTGGQIILDGA